MDRTFGHLLLGCSVLALPAMAFDQAENAGGVYRSYKNALLEIPAWLSQSIYGRPAGADVSRTGGDEPWSAIEVTSRGDTLRFSGNSHNSSGNYFSLHGCNCLPRYENQLPESSLFPENGTVLGNNWFRRSEDWYWFTLESTSSVWMSTCVEGESNGYDTAIAILDENYQLVAMNDDWLECSSGNDRDDDDDDDDEDEDDCGNRTSSGLLVDLPAGNYYAIVGGYQQEKGLYNVEFCFRGQGSADTEDAPARFSLEPNHPNPFNPTTGIPFSLQETGFVRLTVHNLLGQTVATVVDELLVRGEHLVKFDSNSLPSGVYMYRMEAGGQVQARKMVLVR